MPKYLFFFLSVLFASCIRPLAHCDHSYIPVINNSDKPLYIMSTYSYPTVSASVFGIDPISLGDTTMGNPDYYKLPPHGGNKQATYEHECVSSVHLKKNDTSKKIVVFIFDSATIYTLSWDTVKAKNLYLKVYSLNYDSLEQRGWKIVYP